MGAMRGSVWDRRRRRTSGGADGLRPLPHRPTCMLERRLGLGPLGGASACEMIQTREVDVQIRKTVCNLLHAYTAPSPPQRGGASTGAGAGEAAAEVEAEVAAEGEAEADAEAEVAAEAEAAAHFLICLHIFGALFPTNFYI